MASLFISMLLGISLLCILLMATMYSTTNNFTNNFPNNQNNFSNNQNSDLYEEDFSKQRSDLYDKMSRDLVEHGPAFLSGETSQSLSLSQLFTFKDGVPFPVLKAAVPPVRANVLYLNPVYSNPISQVVKQVFHPHFNNGIWLQDANMYHFSMYHASHHLEPVIATEEEIQHESSAVKDVAKTLCPMKIQIDRVLLTSTGVLIGCWQVISGTDPAIIRRKLEHALPHSPKKQLYNKVMLHTSFARLLGFPQTSEHQTYNGKVMGTSRARIAFLNDLVSQLNKELKGFEALLELATWINCIPLPASISGPSLPLPLEADTLIMPNYQISLPSRVIAQAPPEVEMEEADNNGNGDMTNSQDQRVDNSTSQQRVSFNLPTKRPKLS